MNKHFAIYSTKMEVISTGPLYVFDIDGTIANLQHRLPHILKKPKDWSAFFATANMDTPIQWVIDIMKLLPAERIVMITGRSDEIAAETELWLKKYDVPYAELRMRSKGHQGADTVLKLAMAADYAPRIKFIVEDRQGVVDMWRANGFNVLQCDAWPEVGSVVNMDEWQ